MKAAAAAAALPLLLLPLPLSFQITTNIFILSRAAYNDLTIEKSEEQPIYP